MRLSQQEVLSKLKFKYSRYRNVRDNARNWKSIGNLAQKEFEGRSGDFERLYPNFCLELQSTYKALKSMKHRTKVYVFY